MKIERTSLTTVSPRTREELFKRKDGVFYNKERELRHPFGIYNLSLSNIWATFEEVLDELDLAYDAQLFRQQPPDGTWGEKLLRRQEDLVSRIMRHFDDCLSLLACFYPIQSTKSRDDDRKKVMKEPVVQSAWQNIKSLRDHISSTMNHIKHYQGMLRAVVLFSEENAILGYFVERINSHGAIEPHPEVHALYQDAFTAFSFNYDLRYKFWIVYQVSEVVADVITTLQPSLKQIHIEQNSEIQSLRIAKRLEKLPKYLFEDETYKLFPNIVVSKKDTIDYLRLELTESIILPSLKDKSIMAVSWVDDGITNQISLPYINKETQVTIVQQKMKHKTSE